MHGTDVNVNKKITFTPPERCSNNNSKLDPSTTKVCETFKTDNICKENKDILSPSHEEGVGVSKVCSEGPFNMEKNRSSVEEAVYISPINMSSDLAFCRFKKKRGKMKKSVTRTASGIKKSVRELQIKQQKANEFLNGGITINDKSTLTLRTTRMQLRKRKLKTVETFLKK
jgi:hypothetical protein